jgi:DNA-binding NarL/FixJ family response regulator
MRILIADDVAAIRKQLSSILTAQLGLEVCGEAANGKEAVQKARDLNPDLIILDITMPLMNGLEAARTIRGFAPEVPILILTVHKSRQLIEEAQKMGVRGYVTKGDAGQTLPLAVAALLGNSSFFPTEF